MSALDTALHGLRALIADGALRPGDRLPSEGELCERLGVSRGSLREAIRMLAALGVLETRHGSGSYVGELRAADLIGSLSLTVGLLPMAGVLELTELRRVLEPHAAALAAARIDDDTVAVLDGILSEIEASDDFEEHSRLDHAFHMTISKSRATTLSRVSSRCCGRGRAPIASRMPTTRPSSNGTRMPGTAPSCADSPPPTRSRHRPRRRPMSRRRSTGCGCTRRTRSPPPDSQLRLIRSAACFAALRASLLTTRCRPTPLRPNHPGVFGTHRGGSRGKGWLAFRRGGGARRT